MTLVLGAAHGYGANAPQFWWLQLATITLSLAAVFLAARIKLVTISLLSALAFCSADAAVTHAWLLTALANEMTLGWPLATLVFLALVVLLCTLPTVAVVGAAVTFAKTSRERFSPFVFAACAPLAEIATQYVVGFSWSSAGYAALDTPLAKLYEWIGVYGVASLVGLVAAAGATALAHRALERSASSVDARAPLRSVVTMSLVVMVVSVAVFANYWGRRDPAAEGAFLRVRLIQPAVTQLDKFDGTRMRQLARQLAALAQDPSAQLLVAPETALPHSWAALPTDVAGSLLAVVSSSDRVWLIGMFEPDPQLGLLNVSNALRAGSRSAAPQRYAKRRLVPVAEHPTAGLRWLSDALALRYPTRATGDDAHVVFDVGGVGVRTTICLDLAFGGDLSATSAVTGIIVNQSNFAALPGARVRAQFTTIARVRALEQGKPVLLAANDGPTAVIDAHGRVLASLAPGVTGALSHAVQPRAGSTVYAQMGELSWLALLGCIALMTYGATSSGRGAQPGSDTRP